MKIMLCASRRFTVRPPAIMISWRGRMNRKHAIVFSISMTGSGSFLANGVPGIGLRMLTGTTFAPMAR